MAAVGKRQQRRHVGTLRRNAREDEAIDELLATLLDSLHEPPDRGVEPEQRPHQLLHHDPRPVAPRHVQQLVTRDRALRLWIHGEEPVRQQDDRMPTTEAGRLRDLARATDLGPRSHLGPDALERGREDRHPAALPQLPQPHGSCTQPAESRQRTGTQQPPYDRARCGQDLRNRDGLGTLQGHGNERHRDARRLRTDDCRQRQREAGERHTAPIPEAQVADP